MRKKIRFLFTTMVMGSIFSALSVVAQNSSPYWSLAGNSNASSSSKLGTTNSVPLRLFSNNKTRVYISQGGNVGIGTSSPAYKLHVNGNASIATGLRVGNNGSYGYNSAGPGIYGSGSTYGVYGTSPAIGVYGTGGTYGVYGYSSGGWGVWGQSSSSIGVYGSSSSNYGVYAYSSNYPALYAYGVAHYGVEAHSGTTYAVTAYGVSGVYGQGSTSYGVNATSSSYPAIYGYGAAHYGVEAHSKNTWAATGYGVSGVYGQGSTGYGVYGTSTSGYGGYFYSGSSYGLRAATGRSDKNWAAVFDGNVYVYGAYQGSDKNIKKNIEDFPDAIDIINKLRPRSYEFCHEGKFAAMYLPEGRHYGLIAQELETVLPNLVKEVDADLSDPKDKFAPKPTDGKENTQTGTQAAEPNLSQEKMVIKSVNYLELIPVMIKAIQEQNNTINELKTLVLSLSKQAGNVPTGFSKAFITQNAPNPYSNTTVISYYIPDESRNAEIVVSDIEGRVLRTYNATKGQGQITIRTGEFPSGNYNYTLYVNRTKIDTKQMIIANK